jgi:hypothetical protein
VIRTALALVFLFGCDTTVHQSTGLPDAPPSPSCLEAVDHSDFPWIRDNIFEPSCSRFVSCHQGGNPPGHLNLTAARAYAQLVGVPATSVANKLRVAPGDPDDSYILVKLGDLPFPPEDHGTTMPPNSPLLCNEKVKAVRRWIEDGAKEGNETPDAAVADGGEGD